MFAIDHRSNSRLHLFYIKTALQDLRAIDNALKTFGKLSHTSMAGPTLALMSERDKLITSDAAFADANEMLVITKTGSIPSLEAFAATE